jgi:hypothetical protein
MKPVEIALRRGEEERGSVMEGANLRYIVSTYVNITMYSPLQLLYANKKIKTKESSFLLSIRKT